MSKVLIALAEFFLGLVFVYAGAGKLQDPTAFAAAIENYRLCGALESTVLALFLPWLELVAGLSLCLRQARRGALLILFVLTLVFTGAVASAWARGLDISCGCFSREGTSLPMALVRDLGLLVLGAFLLKKALQEVGASKSAKHNSGLA